MPLQTHYYFLCNLWLELTRGLFLSDFTRGDDINNLNTVGNIGEEPGRTIPANLKTQSLEDFSDGSPLIHILFKLRIVTDQCIATLSCASVDQIVYSSR